MGLDTPASANAGGSSLKWWICGLLLLATTLNYMDRSALYQTSVRICNDLGLSNEGYGWLEFSFNIAYGTGALLFGFIVDRGNLRWVYAFIVFAWSMVGFATGFVTAIFWLFVCRILLGLFEAGNWPCGILTVKRVMPPAQRSLGNGLFQSGTALGAIFTPLVVLACLAVSDPDLPLRTAVQIVGGGGGFEVLPFPQYSWQLTFRVIGAVGLLWVVLWLLVVRDRHVAPPPEPPGGSGRSDSYWGLFRDRRFWLLALTVVAVNVPWRSFVVWSPKFLQQDRGYSEADMQRFMTLFYVAADVGSITVGLVTIQLVKRRFSLFSARLWTFVFSASLALLSLIAVHLPQGPTLLIVLLLIGFAVLGSFPTYFALSQEVSAKHQGKVTGTLGLFNAVVMACLAPLQGWLVDTRKSFDLALGLSGLTPLVAVAAVYFLWKDPNPAPPPQRVEP
jgi:ACS family hexuronate transporter-like MFS transporter